MLIEYLIIILPLGVPWALDTVQPYYMFREQSSEEAWSIVSLSNCVIVPNNVICYSKQCVTVPKMLDDTDTDTFFRY